MGTQFSNPLLPALYIETFCERLAYLADCCLPKSRRIRTRRYR